MPVKHVIAVRRILYLKTILDREDHEITKKFIIKKNGIEINEDSIKETNRDTF